MNIYFKRVEIIGTNIVFLFKCIKHWIRGILKLMGTRSEWWSSVWRPNSNNLFT